jgi:hypothetical protein
MRAKRETFGRATHKPRAKAVQRARCSQQAPCSVPLARAGAREPQSVAVCRAERVAEAVRSAGSAPRLLRPRLRAAPRVRLRARHLAPVVARTSRAAAAALRQPWIRKPARKRRASLSSRCRVTAPLRATSRASSCAATCSRHAAHTRADHACCAARTRPCDATLRAACARRAAQVDAQYTPLKPIGKGAYGVVCSGHNSKGEKARRARLRRCLCLRLRSAPPATRRSRCRGTRRRARRLQRVSSRHTRLLARRAALPCARPAMHCGWPLTPAAPGGHQAHRGRLRQHRGRQAHVARDDAAAPPEARKHHPDQGAPRCIVAPPVPADCPARTQDVMKPPGHGFFNDAYIV